MDQAQPKPIRLHSKPLREIRDEQASTKLIIPKAPFKRIVTDEVCELGGPDMRVRKDALEAFQTGAEAYLIGMFQDANLIAIRSHRETVHPRDVALWKSITSDKNI